MESQIFGRVAHAALRVVSDAINGMPFARLDPKLRKALLFLKDRVLYDRPKEMVSMERKVIHIYTDACFETSLSGLGGVAFSADGQSMGFFGESLSAGQVERIKKLGQKTIIAELESLAIPAGVETWMRGLRDCLAVIFCDNDSALASMIKVRSHNQFVFAVACILADYESSGNHSFSFERVPSVSNLADAPSRLNFDSHSLDHRSKPDLDTLVDNVRSNPLL